MIDYHAHLALLRRSQRPAVEAKGDDGAGEAATDARSDAKIGAKLAALGTLLDHLFAHAGGVTATELELLQTAAPTWRELQIVMAEVAAWRRSFEALVKAPDRPGAADELGRFETWLAGLEPRIRTLIAKFRAINSQLVRLRHVPAHGSSSNRPAHEWSSRDVFLGRGTTRFLRALQGAVRRAERPELAALVSGAAIGHAANIEGSAYLGRVSGGPRRSHRYRHRVAGYSVGAWLREHRPAQTPSLKAIRSLVRFGPASAPSLPPLLETVLVDAWRTTYGDAGVATPDVARGYALMLAHLELLDQFKPLPLPRPIEGELVERSNALSLSPKNDPNGPPGVTHPTTIAEGGPPADASVGEVVAWIFCGLAVAVGFVLLALLGSSSSGTTDPPLTPGPDGAIRVQMKLLEGPEALRQVQRLHQLHAALYELGSNALKVARLYGLLYPSPDDLIEPWFSQFLAVPVADDQPRRPIEAPSRFLFFPTSAVERPAVAPSSFAAGASPDALLAAAGEVASLALRLVDSERDEPNYDLDADRGPQHRCWTTRGAFNSDPISVELLAFDAID